MLVNVMLTKEQAALYLPLLPQLATQLATQESPSSSWQSVEPDSVKPHCTITELFEKARKNVSTTPAQRHLQVSNTCCG